MSVWIALLGAGFLASLDDVPTPPGFAETGEAAVFSTETGRVVATEAVGPGRIEAARAFYETALPALGWTRSSTKALAFRRGAEVLTLEAGAGDDGRVVVRYRLATIVAADTPPQGEPQ